MATVSASPSTSVRTRTQSVTGYPEGGLRFDWMMTGLSILFIAGLWVDVWAHFHGRTDNTFFTPWHFMFYSAFGLTALFIGYNQFRNLNKGYAFQRALPRGYWLSLIGTMIFAFGGVGDMIWHILFGIEGGSEALTSPTHLMLAIGMGLVFSGTLRAASYRPLEQSRGWRTLGPAIISVTLVLALLSLFSSYAHPIVTPLAAKFFNTQSQSSPISQLYMMNADGSMQTRLTTDTETASSSAAWSPDGQQIAFTVGNFTDSEKPDEVADIFVMDVDGTNRLQLTNGKGLNREPSWSPDGKRIVYSGTIDGKPELFIINTTGGEPIRLTNNDLSEWRPRWSPDGSKIAFSTSGDNSGDIYVVDADGKNPKPLTSSGNSYVPSWSPDGKLLTYTQGVGSDGFDIYVMNSDGTNPKALTNDEAFDGYSTFSPDGKQIIFESGRNDTSALYVMPASGEIESGAQAVNLSNNPALNLQFGGSASWSPDGQKIIFDAPGATSNTNINVQDFGVASVMLQAALLSGMMLFLVWRWKLPFGAMTFVFGVSAAMLTLLNDFYLLALVGIVAGLLADILIWRWKLSGEASLRFHVFAFIVPLVYYALYFLTLQLLTGVGWNIHVWAGSIFIAGVIGLLVSYLMASTLFRNERQSIAAAA